jgi:GTP-binding protein
MHPVHAVFVQSAPSVSKCPESTLPEFAFTGRSNVGKSSLINMLVRKKGLAKTSSTPGKTRLINHFSIDDKWFLVDLPGYGYARISLTEREKLRKIIQGYILKRETLVCTFLLIDARLEPQAIDLEFMNWMAEAGKPFVLLFTKTDKLSRGQLAKMVHTFKKELEQSWDQLPMLVLTSSVTGDGRETILSLIAELI